MPDGYEVHAYRLVNANGVELITIEYGAAILALKVPDRDGKLDDVVLGFDTMEAYLNSPHYVGAVVGRCAGRIRNSRFQLDGVTYGLTENNSPHHLHGGLRGCDKWVWAGKPYEDDRGVGIDFAYYSLDDSEGYPGNLTVTVRYYLTHENILMVNYFAQTDKATIINLTQHTYWNLSGTTNPVLNHGLNILADRFLPIDPDKLPTGESSPVADTPFDFRHPKLIGAAFDVNFEQLRLGHGLDHCFELNKPEGELGEAGMLYDPASGRLLTVHTTEPGLQVYTGSALTGVGKYNMEMGPFSGICLETQHFPDAPNHPDFPSIVLKPGMNYQSSTLFVFSVLG